jgi:hypothetical protein
MAAWSRPEGFPQGAGCGVRMDDGLVMPSRCPEFDRIWPSIAVPQDGIVTRRQLISAGLTPGVARREVVARRWRRLHPGVYATFTGPVPDQARIWAALLRAGPAAAASHRTALWLWGVIHERPEPVDVAIPHDRRCAAAPGVRLHRMRGLAQLVHPAAAPPRLRIEAAVLATTNGTSATGTVIDLALRAPQRRLTTASRLLIALNSWPRHRWRGLLREILAETRTGATSALELRYVREVERAHGLPCGRRNVPEALADRSCRYRDVRYEAFSTVVELDGREAHPVDEAFRDLRRDNAVVAAGDWPLRYGWRDVAGRPCEVAGQVGGVLQRQGWRGEPRRRSPTCRV